MKHAVHEAQLKNGAKGLIIDVPGATVASFRFHFLAGNRFVKSKNAYETAHVMEHMAFGANEGFHDAHAFGAEFEKNGAHHNAYTSDLSMVYVADCADFEWDRILDLQRLAITKPLFVEGELHAEIGNVKNELTGYLNSHPRLLWPRVQQALGEPVLGFDERLKQVPNTELAHIRQHYKSTHAAKNMRFAIAGKMDSRVADIIDQLESWELPDGDRQVIPRDALHDAEPFLIRRKEASNITFAWSLALPRKLDDEELDAMAGVDHILTGTLHSRILGAARKHGLAYGMFSDTTAYQYDSTWDFGAQVNIDTIEPLFDIIVREMRHVLDGNISDEEVEAAKQYALGKHQMGCQTVNQINNWYGSRYFFDERVDDFAMRPAAIKAINKERMVEIAREFIKHKTYVLGAVGSTKIDLVRSLNDKLAALF